MRGRAPEPSQGYHLLSATKAGSRRGVSGAVWRRLASYRAALELAPTDVERRYLLRRLAEMDPPTPTERDAP